MACLVYDVRYVYLHSLNLKAHLVTHFIDFAFSSSKTIFKRI